MRISDWSSDVCSSDLLAARGVARLLGFGALAFGEAPVRTDAFFGTPLQRSKQDRGLVAARRLAPTARVPARLPLGGDLRLAAHAVEFLFGAREFGFDRRLFDLLAIGRAHV